MVEKGIRSTQILFNLSTWLFTFVSEFAWKLKIFSDFSPYQIALKFISESKDNVQTHSEKHSVIQKSFPAIKFYHDKLVED